eukprot:scaffold102696_cov23-Tisochrysis_lutea.AAC.4
MSVCALAGALVHRQLRCTVSRSVSVEAGGSKGRLRDVHTSCRCPHRNRWRGGTCGVQPGCTTCTLVAA